MSTDPKHAPAAGHPAPHAERTSPLPFFALLAVFTITVITAALYVSFGHH
jgi:hypothetical protein